MKLKLHEIVKIQRMDNAQHSHITFRHVTWDYHHLYIIPNIPDTTHPEYQIDSEDFETPMGSIL